MLYRLILWVCLDCSINVQGTATQRSTALIFKPDAVYGDKSRVQWHHSILLLDCTMLWEPPWRLFLKFPKYIRIPPSSSCSEAHHLPSPFPPPLPATAVFYSVLGGGESRSRKRFKTAPVSWTFKKVPTGPSIALHWWVGGDCSCSPCFAKSWFHPWQYSCPDQS